MAKILILEDDTLFAQTLQDLLEDEDYEAMIAKDGQEALELSFNHNFDLFLLDINVPKIDGKEFLKVLRDSDNETPVLMVTSYTDKTTLSECFMLGCDDYVKKSAIDLDEILLRIKSIFKRCNKLQEPIKINKNISLCPITKRIFIDKEEQRISVKVVLLLELFLECKNMIITKQMIIQKLWSTSQEHSEGSIRVYINTLKKLLGNECIKNIKGVGYRFEL